VSHTYVPLRKTTDPSVRLAAIGALVVLLGLTSLVSFELFHTAVELIYVTVALSVLIVALALREFQDDDFAVFLGIALVASAVLHVVHLLDYTGIDLITVSPDPPTQLWIAASLMVAVSFVVAPFVLGRRVRVLVVSAVYGVADALVLASIYWWQVFPSALTAEQGLTTFKRVTEYVICAILAAAIAILWRRRERLQRGVFRLLAAALVSRMLAELAFTVYTGPHAAANMLGHIFLLLFAILIFQAVVEDTLTRPHALAIETLEVDKQEARSEQLQEAATRRAFGELLDLTPTFLAEQDLTSVADTACRAARELFACDVAMLSQIDRDEMVLLAAVPADPALTGLRFPVSDDPSLTAQLESRSSLYVDEVGDAPVGPHLTELRSLLGLRAVFRSPIGAGQPADLMLVLGWRQDRPAPGEHSLALIERFGYQVDVALTQARRRELQTETEQLHRRFERSLLPKLPVDHPGLDIHLHYQPGERKLLLGGDFVDVVDLGEHGVAVLVGDVSGHGPDAAALGSTLRSAWEALVLGDGDPVRTAQALRRVAERERHSEYVFATALLAWIDPDAADMTYLNLGHPPPYLCHGGQALPLDDQPQPPLGATDRPLEAPRHATLPAGWSLFFYTDGLIEAPLRSGTAERFGEQRLRAAVRRLACGRIGEEELRTMLAAMQEEAGGVFPDDVAVVLVSQSEAAAGHADRQLPGRGDTTV